MLPLTAFLALGFWPIAILLVMSVLIVLASEIDEGRLATGSLVVGVGLVCYLRHVNPLTWVAEHPGDFAVRVGVYFLIGVIWGCVKWYFYCLKRLREGMAQPEASEESTRILGWMTYWVWSMPFTLCNDPVRFAWRVVYGMVSGYFQRISDHVFANSKNRRAQRSW